MSDISSLTSKSTRTTYHTNTKFREKLGILSEYERKQIPKSTLHGFKHYDFSKVFGYENQSDCDFALVLMEKIIKCKIFKKIIKMYKAYHRLKKTAINIFTQIKNIKPHLKKYKKQIVTIINHVKSTIGLDKACRFFRISVSRFYSWLHQVHHSCPASVLKQCRHRWSHQITQREEKIMVKCLNDSFFKGWAIY